MASVSIIATGSELVEGRTRDSNAAHLGALAVRLGFAVEKITICHDTEEEIIRAIEDVPGDVNLIFITGGLGPTDDDITVETIARYTGREMVVHDESYRRMVDFFSTRRMNELPPDKKMVSVPAGSRVMVNQKGLAPGFILQEKGKTFCVLPGPPRENHPMADITLSEMLKEMFPTLVRSTIPLHLTGIRESDVNNRISPYMNDHNITWSITSHSGVVSLHLEDRGDDVTFIEHIDYLKEELKEYLLRHGSTLGEEIIALLQEGDITLSTAESCTGGMVSQWLTAIPGSSSSFMGGAVTYSNLSKEKVLGVSGDTLRSSGAVSEETAKEMAEGGRELFQTDYSLAITGIAGPGGGSDEKPVGTVCFAIASPEERVTMTKHFPGDREMVRNASTQFILQQLRRILIQ